MPKKVSKEVLNRNRNIIEQTMESFGGSRYAPAAATRMITDNLISTQIKPVLRQRIKGNEEAFKEKFGFNIFLSEATGTFFRYRWAIDTTAAHLASVDGTPLRELEFAAFGILDHYMPNYWRTKGSIDSEEHPVPIEKAKPRHDFRKLVRQELTRMAKHGHIDFDERREMVYRENIDPLEMTEDCWGGVLHKTPSSWKRAVGTTVVNFCALRLNEMYVEIRDRHLGREYGIKPLDTQKWWILTGPFGAGFAFKDRDSMLHLQYAKAGFRSSNLEEELSETFKDINLTIKFLPWIHKEQIKEMYPEDYPKAEEIWYRNPEVAPAEIAGELVSKELAIQLRWGYRREALGLEQHNARPVLEQLWRYLSPRVAVKEGQMDLSEIKEASDVVITALSDLSGGRKFMASTPMEKRAMEALSTHGYIEETAGVYEVKKGMEQAIGYLALYVGKL